VAYSFVQYPVAVTTTGPFNVTFPYLQKYQVEVRKNNVLLVSGVDYTWATASTISLVANAVNGDVIEIRRNSLKKADGTVGRLVDFTNSAKLTEADLDNSALQCFYLAQEAFDAAANAMQLVSDGTYDATSKRIKNVANPTLAQDAATKNYVDLTALGSFPSPLAIGSGGTGQATKQLAFDALSPNTTKGDITVHNGTANVRKAVGTHGQLKFVDTTQADSFRYSDPHFYPINVNPNWLLDQINEGGAYAVSAGSVYGPDGWQGVATGTGTFTMQRVVDPDNSALLCMKVSCTVADAALAAGDRYWLATAIEGYDVAALKSGTAQAGSISIRFKAKFPAAGTYSVALGNSAGTRGYPKQIVVPDANENEYTLTFPLDTAGAWLYTNGVGLWLYVGLGVGSTYQGNVDAWNATQAVAAAGQTNFMALNTNVMYLKRVHVFPGPIPYPYANADIQRDLAKALRYFYKTWLQGTAVGTITGPGQISWVTNGGTYGQQFCAYFKQPMRSTPTVLLYSPDTGIAGNIRDVTAVADGNAGANEIYPDYFMGVNIPVTDGHLCRMHYYAITRLS
jgi:hypothetical protein